MRSKCLGATKGSQGDISKMMNDTQRLDGEKDASSHEEFKRQNMSSVVNLRSATYGLKYFQLTGYDVCSKWHTGNLLHPPDRSHRFCQ